MEDHHHRRGAAHPAGGVLRDRITFGVGFLDPVKYLVRAKILYPETHQFPIIAPRVQSLAIILGLGARIGDRLYVGGGFEALAALVGTIDIRLDATAAWARAPTTRWSPPTPPSSPPPSI